MGVKGARSDCPRIQAAYVPRVMEARVKTFAALTSTMCEGGFGHKSVRRKIRCEKKFSFGENPIFSPSFTQIFSKFQHRFSSTVVFGFISSGLNTHDYTNTHIRLLESDSVLSGFLFISQVFHACGVCGSPRSFRKLSFMLWISFVVCVFEVQVTAGGQSQKEIKRVVFYTSRWDPWHPKTDSIKINSTHFWANLHPHPPSSSFPPLPYPSDPTKLHIGPVLWQPLLSPSAPSLMQDVFAVKASFPLDLAQTKLPLGK